MSDSFLERPVPCPVCGQPRLRRQTAEGTPLYLEKTKKRKPRNGLYVITGLIRCRPALFMIDEGQTLYRRCLHHPPKEHTTAHAHAAQSESV